MNPRTRRAALYAIGVIAILASANALAHSYAGLYDWAVHHQLGGWQAISWPAEIDVFLAVGELALYVAYLDGWPARQRIWPWATALIGLAVSVAGNVGHIEPLPGHPVILADRLTAAASPVAAFAGLTIGLLVLKMTCQRPAIRLHVANAAAEPARHPADDTLPSRAADSATPVLAGLHPASAQPFVQTGTDDCPAGRQPAEPESDGESPSPPNPGPGTTERQALLRDACLIYQAAVSKGEHVSQRRLASQLRGHGHRFSNQHLQAIAASAGLGTPKVA
ncbi:MAG: hypothetical protein ABSB01_21785 [Streptosporangiaceae bacterium]|jgi:hypothetical protein